MHSFDDSNSLPIIINFVWLSSLSFISSWITSKLYISAALKLAIAALDLSFNSDIYLALIGVLWNGISFNLLLLLKNSLLCSNHWGCE